MSAVRERFDREEKLRAYLEGEGLEHDCLEAGCGLNPAGQPTPPGPAARRKPRPGWVTAELRALWGR